MATEKTNTAVTGVVSAEMREFIEDYRWQNRKTVSDVVREAFDVWGAGAGFKASGDSAETSEESGKSRKR